jgi:hypothetical protein
MKYFLAFIACFSLLFALISFNKKDKGLPLAYARVTQLDGLYIFTDCLPINQFDSIGSVDLGFISGTQYDNIKTNLIKRTKKQFPEAEGLILKLKKDGLDYGIPIVFKKQ